MIWVTWRQFRAQAIAAATALVVLGVVLALTGPHLANLYDTSGLGTCTARGDCAAVTRNFLDAVTSDSLYPALYFLTAVVLVLAPALIGVFWGAPLVTREMEAGSFRLAWNQSVTRTRWLTVKLTLIGAAAVAVTALLSLMITWWASPIDRAGGFPVNLSQLSRFSPLLFATRGITPIGYAAFAVALGVAAGVLVHRTVPAMAITAAVFAVVQIIMPTGVRPHLITPAHATVAIHPTLDTVEMASNGQMTVPANIPGAWVISNQTITTSGQVFVLPDVPACQSGTQQACNDWLAGQHLRQLVNYQPAGRYWVFQFYETVVFLALALALAALSVWWISRRLS